jgi:hypothetical protein
MEAETPHIRAGGGVGVDDDIGVDNDVGVGEDVDEDADNDEDVDNGEDVDKGEDVDDDIDVVKESSHPTSYQIAANDESALFSPPMSGRKVEPVL